MHNFRPVSDIEYTVVLDTGKKLIITFTIDNDVYPEEEFCGLQNYECYDNDDVRYICYVKVCYCDRDDFYITLRSKDEHFLV